MAIDEHTVKRTAVDDPDLKPLWDSMSGKLWGEVQIESERPDSLLAVERS